MLGQHTEFYPSTEAIAKQIHSITADHFRAYRRYIRILDPSAGNGVLLDMMQQHDYKNLYAIEIDVELRYILQSKGYKVLDSDWLQYNEPISFDAILMNPPFSDGIRHIMKSWDFLASGGILCSVIPNTMLEGSTTNKKLLSNLVQRYGETIDIKSAFSSSYRTTQVQCKILILRKTKELKPSWMDEISFETDNISCEDFTDNPLACSNQIQALVRQYEVVKEALIDRYKAQLKVDFYLRGIEDPVYNPKDREHNQCLTIKEDFAEQLKVLKSRFWKTLFTKTKLGQGTTSAFKTQFEQGSLQIIDMAFNANNILEVLSMYFNNRESIMLDAVQAVFNKCISYHAENLIHTEGWKNNRTNGIHRKIIIPDQNLIWSCAGFERWNTISSHDLLGQFLDDFDKVLCYLTCKSIDDELFISAREAINNFTQKCGNNYQVKFQSTFFTLRIYKKGTIHLVFSDQKTQDVFNKTAGQGRKVIGADY